MLGKVCLWVAVLALTLFQGIDAQVQCIGSSLFIHEGNLAEVEACPELLYTTITINNPANVPRIDLSNLTTVQSLTITGGANLQEIKLGNLVNVTGTLKISSVSFPLSFSSLEQTGNIDLFTVTFPSVSFPVLKTAAHVTISNCGGDLDDFEALTHADSITIRGGFYFIVRGFNNDLNIVGRIRVEQLAYLEITGFNGNITADEISTDNVGDALISGFNGVVNLQSLTFKDLNGQSEVSGFNGDVTIATTMTILANHQAQYSGFNGKFTVGDLIIQRQVLTAPASSSASVPTVQLMSSPSDSASSSASSSASASASASASSSPSASPKIKLMAYDNNYYKSIFRAFDNVQASSILFKDLDTIQLGGFTGVVGLSTSLKFEGCTNVDFLGNTFTSLYLTTDSVDIAITGGSLRLTENLFSLHPSSPFKELHAISIVNSISQYGYSRFAFGLVEAVEELTIEDWQWQFATFDDPFQALAFVGTLTLKGAIATFDFGYFPKLVSVNELDVQSTPLTNLDAFLSLRQVSVISINQNSNLLSVAGFCGLTNGLNNDQFRFIDNNPQLCASDVDTIFHSDFGFDPAYMVNENNQGASCGRVCDCQTFASHEVDMCQNDACASVRGGVTCVACEWNNEIYNRTDAVCQSCPDGTLVQTKTQCQACSSTFGSECTLCNQQRCVSCEEPAQVFSGSCYDCNLPCVNNGSCDVLGGSMMCVCPEGFSGPTCNDTATSLVGFTAQTPVDTATSTPRHHVVVGREVMVAFVANAKHPDVKFGESALYQVSTPSFSLPLGQFDTSFGGVSPLRLSPEGQAASLRASSALNPWALSYQVWLTPQADWLQGQRTADITVDLEFLVTVDMSPPPTPPPLPTFFPPIIPPVPFPVSVPESRQFDLQQFAALASPSNSPASSASASLSVSLQSTDPIMSRVPSTFTLSVYSTQEAADRAHAGLDPYPVSSTGIDGGESSSGYGDSSSGYGDDSSSGSGSGESSSGVEGSSSGYGADSSSGYGDDSSSGYGGDSSSGYGDDSSSGMESSSGGAVLPGESASSATLSEGEITGVVIGSVLGCVLLVWVGLFFMRRASASLAPSSADTEMVDVAP